MKNRNGRRRSLEGGDGEPSVLVLREGPSRGRRGIVAVVVAVAVLLGLYLGRDTVERWTGWEVPEPADVASLFRSTPSGAGAGGVDGGGAEPGGTTSPDGSPGTDSVLLERRLDSLEVRLDSLDVGLERYRERHGDFVRGRLGCEGLSRGFARVEEHFDAASRAFGRVEARAPEATGAAAAASERYRELSTDTDSVGRVFAASGCEPGAE